MEKYLSILKSCTLFSQMSDVEIKNLMSCLNIKVKAFDKNSTIIAENTQARHIGIVLSGTAQIIHQVSICSFCLNSKKYRANIFYDSEDLSIDLQHFICYRGSRFKSTGI